MRSRQYEFLEHYPFAELHLLGWRLKELAPTCVNASPRGAPMLPV
ncbi:hypothetical protein [Rhodococcus sp. O3]